MLVPLYTFRGFFFEIYERCAFWTPENFNNLNWVEYWKRFRISINSQVTGVLPQLVVYSMRSHSCFTIVCFYEISFNTAILSGKVCSFGLQYAVSTNLKKVEEILVCLKSQYSGLKQTIWKSRFQNLTTLLGFPFALTLKLLRKSVILSHKWWEH